MNPWPTTIYGFTVTKKPIGSGAPLSKPINGVLHTTEGAAGTGGDEAAWSTLHANDDPSHFVLDEDSIIQCRSLLETSSALRHSPGEQAVYKGETDAHAIQIEIAGRSQAGLWLPSIAIQARIAAVMAYASAFHGIPLVVPNDWPDTITDVKPYPSSNNSRRQWAQTGGRWPNMRGWWMHMEVPGQAPTNHWDCGALRRSVLIAAAKAFLGQEDEMDQKTFDALHRKSHGVGSNDALTEMADDALAVGDWAEGKSPTAPARAAIVEHLNASKGSGGTRSAKHLHGLVGAELGKTAVDEPSKS